MKCLKHNSATTLDSSTGQSLAAPSGNMSSVAKAAHGKSGILRKATMLLMALLLFVPAAFGQQPGAIVKGVVSDENGEPLTGAVVSIPGSSRGTSTNIDGEYTIRASKGETLEVAYIGYNRQRIKLKEVPATVNISMVPDAKMQMDEVVVIGYGTVKKTDMTGSVTNVKMSDIKDSPVLSVDQALQGRIAGADIMTSTGEPGANTSIRIRGTRSISASNEPLIVVDGVMDAVHDLNDLNMADIASISVLKDASSTAIYGSRGSNGVIIVTTKKGSSTSGKPNVTLKADVGFSQLPKLLDIMSAAEFAQYRNDYAYFNTADGQDAIGAGTPMNEYPFKDPFSLGEGTNWIKEITRTAPTQNYALSVSGKGDKGKYYASVSYNDTQGIIKKSGMARITGMLSVDYQFAKWLNVGYKGSYTHRDQDMNLADIGGSSYYQAAVYLAPTLKRNDGFNPFYNNGSRINTPVATINLNTYNLKRISQNHAVTFDINLLKNLKLRSQNSYYAYDRHTFRYYPSTLPKKLEGEGGQAYRAEWSEYSLSTENTLTWKVDTKKGHNFDVMGGYTAYSYHSDSFTLDGNGYMDDKVMWNNMNAVPDKLTYAATTGTSDKVKMSFLARANYNYKQRYYITATGRYDGASNFAANNKWAFFPSGALKWNVANEPWMKGVKWLDELSIRASAGRTGNDAISAYRSIAALSSTTNGYIFGGSQPVAYYPSRLASPNLTWEKTDLYNVATDMSFLNSAITVTAEAYISKTSDLLLTVQTASQSGYTNRFINLGKTTNKGVEFSIESRNITKRDFSWTTNFTIAHNSQMVDDIGSEDFVAAQKSGGNNPYMMQGYVKGYPLNALWGFRYGGVWHSVEEFNRNQTTHAYASATQINANNINNQLGSPRYHDINRDGVLDQNDLVYLGNADPYLYGGLQNNFRLGNFRLGVYFTYSLGGKIYNYTELYMMGSKFTNQYRYMLDAWHPVRNPQSDLPRAGCTDTAVPCDKMVHDATYYRLKNVTLGYTFEFNKKNFIRDLQFTVSGENLYLWKKYNGFDPDVSSSDDAALRRVDMGAYPKARTVVFSVQVRY